MNTSRTALIGAIGSAALLASVGAGFAQSSPAQHGRVIAVPPGAVVLVLPAGSAADAAFADVPGMAFPQMPSPIAMIRQMDQQMDQMMADMQRSVASPAWIDPNRMIDAAMQGMPQQTGPVAGVVVTSFSDGHGTCTQRVTYSGNGAPPVVQISSTGNACASAGMPTATPTESTPRPVAPYLIQVQDRSRAPAPLTYAQAGN
jgi:hypothetical protein